MGRIQRGYIYEAAGAFFVRFYTTEIIDGKPQRVQRSHRLCDKDGKKYRSVTDKNVKLLRDEHMVTINRQHEQGRVSQPDMTVTEFWEQVYLPFAKENLRLSTVKGYEKIWEQHLNPHFGTLRLRSYTTVMGSEFLTALAKKFGRNTLQHIRSLASGLFAHAVNRGRLQSNPWREVKILGRVKQAEQTEHYTLQEIQDILAALEDSPDGQCVMALAFFLGLRPSELIALRWEDFSDNKVQISRAFVRSQIGPTKTPASVASLPVIEPVLSILKRWHEKSGCPSEGWLFPKKGTDKIPAGIVGVTRRAILPALEKKGITWKGIYSARRGAATMLVDLTKGLVAAQELLRHKSMSTTADFYKKQTQHALTDGMKLLGSAYAETGK